MVELQVAVMLKHCSPSSVDIRRRSRRNLLTIVDADVVMPPYFDRECQEDNMIVTDHALKANVTNEHW